MLCENDLFDIAGRVGELGLGTGASAPFNPRPLILSNR